MMIYPFIGFVPLLPLLTALIIDRSKGRSEKICLIGTFSQLFAFVLSIFALDEVRIHGPISTPSIGVGVLERSAAWRPSGLRCFT